MQPLVSIIIPTFNRAHLLGETLDSVLEQTYQNWECIVVDDGSTDDTEALVTSYIDNDSRFQYHKRPDTFMAGGNDARNFGFQICNGDFVQWFDDDDVVLEDYIAARMPLFKNQAQMVIGTGYVVDMELNNKRLLPIRIRENLYKDYVLYASKIMTQSIIFRKSYLAAQTSLFRPDLTRAQESELFLRLFYNIQAETYVIFEKGLFLYRQHPLNKTTKDQVYNKSFKESRSIIYADNLKKCIALGDQKLVTLLYHNLLTYFFEGIKHDHRSNSRWVLKVLIRDMRLVSKKLSVLLWVYGNIALLLNYPVYRFHSKLKFHASLKHI